MVEGSCQKASRTIPDLTKTRIRERCGYGCVICGSPIVEYHHIHGFDPNQGHIESEITLLCPQDHTKADDNLKGLIPREAVIAYDADPINIRRGCSTEERVWYSNSEIRVVLGPFAFIQWAGQPLAVLTIDSCDLLTFDIEKGHGLLSASLFDFGQGPTVRIFKNELVYSVVAGLDIQFKRNRLTGQVAGLPAFALKFEAATSTFVVETGMFIHNGAWVDIHDGVLEVLPRSAKLAAYGKESARSPEFAFPVGIRCGRQAPWDKRLHGPYFPVPVRVKFEADGGVSEVGEDLYAVAAEPQAL